MSIRYQDLMCALDEMARNGLVQLATKSYDPDNKETHGCDTVANIVQVKSDKSIAPYHIVLIPDIEGPLGKCPPLSFNPIVRRALEYMLSDGIIDADEEAELVKILS